MIKSVIRVFSHLIVPFTATPTPNLKIVFFSFFQNLTYDLYACVGGGGSRSKEILSIKYLYVQLCITG